MIPNFIWFVFPASNDVLRSDSVTPIVDVIGSVAQAAFIAAMCLLKRKDAVLYYNGIADPYPVISLRAVSVA